MNAMTITTRNLLVELFVEELPPKVLRKLGDAFASVLFRQLEIRGLAGKDSVLTAFASPRRLGAHITNVLSQAPDLAETIKLMPKAVAFDDTGKPRPALLKKAEGDPRLENLIGMGANAELGPDKLFLKHDGKTEMLFFSTLMSGQTIRGGLQRSLNEAIDALPIPKVMSYPLPLATGNSLCGWETTSFVRPAHGLVALHGAEPARRHQRRRRHGR